MAARGDPSWLRWENELLKRSREHWRQSSQRETQRALSLEAQLHQRPDLSDEEISALLMASIFGGPDKPHAALESARGKLRALDRRKGGDGG